MADDTAGEKTESATPRRREEVRERGQVAKSADLSSSLVLLVGFAVLKMAGPTICRDILAVFRYPFAHLWEPVPGPDTLVSDGFKATWAVFLALLPVLGALMVIAALATMIQVGWHITPQAFELKLDRFNPVTGMQRIFSKRGMMKVATGIAKIALVSAVLYVVIAGEMPHVMSFMGLFDYQNNNTGRIVAYLLDMLCWVGMYAGATLAVLAVIDFAYQRWQHEQDIKMTKQEVKDEMKNMEGDPQIKRKRMERARQMAQRKMEKAVPEADVIVTNPTHFSCALRYRDKDPAPRLVAKGTDRMALRIREIASQHGVPVVEKPELARALFRWCEVDEFVPGEYWGAVAEVLAYVYEIDKRRRERALGADKQPV